MLKIIKEQIDTNTWKETTINAEGEILSVSTFDENGNQLSLTNSKGLTCRWTYKNGDIYSVISDNTETFFDMKTSEIIFNIG